MGSNPPGAPLLEDELDAEGDERKNSHPPHYASRGMAGGCEHVGVPHSQAAAETWHNISRGFDKERADLKHAGSGHEGVEDENKVMQEELACQQRRPQQHPKPLALLGERLADCSRRP